MEFFKANNSALMSDRAPLDLSFPQKNEKELRILRNLETSIANGNFRLKRIGVYIWLCSFFGFAGIGLGLLLCVEPAIPNSVPVMLAAAGGSLFGAATYAQKSIEQLNIIKSYINSGSLKAKIDDIVKSQVN